MKIISGEEGKVESLLLDGHWYRLVPGTLTTTVEDGEPVLSFTRSFSRSTNKQKMQVRLSLIEAVQYEPEKRW